MYQLLGLHGHILKYPGGNNNNKTDSLRQNQKFPWSSESITTIVLWNNTYFVQQRFCVHQL